MPRFLFRSEIHGRAVFSLGLSLVMTAGAELYTGNTMMAAGAADGRISWGETVMNWVRVWVGNGLGAVALALVVWLSHAAETGTAGVGLMTIAAGKMSAPWWTVFWRAALQPARLLGRLMACAGRSVADRCVGVLLPVAAFVALGFEHCVANLFFLPMALLLKASGFAPEGVNLEAIQFSAPLWVNLSAATLGNTVAGAGWRFSTVRHTARGRRSRRSRRSLRSGAQTLVFRIHSDIGPDGDFGPKSSAPASGLFGRIFFRRSGRFPGSLTRVKALANGTRHNVASHSPPDVQGDRIRCAQRIPAWCPTARS